MKVLSWFFSFWIYTMLKLLSLLCILMPFHFSCSSEVSEFDHSLIELNECASLLKSTKEVEELYAQFGFESSSTYRPLEKNPEDVLVEIDAPYADIDNLIMDVWQAILVRVTLEDIMSLALTCRTTYMAYFTLPFSGVIRKKLFLSKDFESFRQNYRFLETPAGRPNFIFPETYQSLAHRMAILCHKEENLKNLVKRLEGNDDKQEKLFDHLLLKNERVHLLNVINDNWISASFIHHVLEDAARNFPYFSTKEQDDNLSYLASYSQYPHVVHKHRQLLRNVLLQLSTFLVLEAPQVYGLYRYFQLVPPMGSVLKSMTKIPHLSIWGIKNTFNERYPYVIKNAFNRRYPYVPEICIGNYSWDDIDYKFNWYDGPSPYCKGSWFDGTRAGNLSECAFFLKELKLNTTYWLDYLSNGTRWGDTLCSPNLDGSSITCGTVGTNWDKSIQLKFNTADMNCANKHWMAGYGSLAILGALGSAILFWEMMGGYYNMHGGGACVALVFYIISLTTVFSVPSTYGNMG